MPEIPTDRLSQLRADLFEIAICARGWVPDARLLGNVKASTILAACADALDLVDQEIARRK